jgi:hypothetical protein
VQRHQSLYKKSYKELVLLVYITDVKVNVGARSARLSFRIIFAFLSYMVEYREKEVFLSHLFI